MIASLSEKKQTTIIVLLSIVVPVLVAFLLFNPTKLSIAGNWVYFLPSLHAVVNGLTAVVLAYAVWAVKNGQVTAHKKAMTVALILGGLFLISYVTYHSSVPSTKFGGEGMIKLIYLGLLASHIVFAAITLPVVLFAYFYAWTGKVEKHRKVVKYAFPIWFYVSVTGVVVYFMISPYYQF